MPTARFSVVVPVFRNEASLGRVVERLVELAARLDGALEAVFVIDGSPDASMDVLNRQLADGRLQAQVLELSRNFGSFSAIRAGMRVARGDFVAVMAADLQEPLEVVERFFQLLQRGDCDIAFGARATRADSSWSSRTYWRLYRRFVNSDIPIGGVDIFGCTSVVARRVVSFPETHTSLVGLLFWIGYRRAFVPYDRVARDDGESGWTTRRKMRYLFDSVYAFTDLPIVLLQVVGAIGLIGSVIGASLVLGAWVLGAIDQPGYTPLMLAILASASAILVGLGVVGSYVWRAYENGKARPLELVASHAVFERSGEGQGVMAASIPDNDARHEQ